jgi:hypothetical protein
MAVYASSPAPRPCTIGTMIAPSKTPVRRIVTTATLAQMRQGWSRAFDSAIVCSYSTR